MNKSSLRKALFVLLKDQFDCPDLEVDAHDGTFTEYIIYALIEKNENICPFKNYVGKCNANNIGCGEGLNIDCTRDVREVWKDFIGIEEAQDE